MQEYAELITYIAGIPFAAFIFGLTGERDYLKIGCGSMLWPLMLVMVVCLGTLLVLCSPLLIGRWIRRNW